MTVIVLFMLIVAAAVFWLGATLIGELARSPLTRTLGHLLEIFTLLVIAGAIVEVARGWFGLWGGR